MVCPPSVSVLLPSFVYVYVCVSVRVCVWVWAIHVCVKTKKRQAFVVKQANSSSITQKRIKKRGEKNIIILFTKKKWIRMNIVVFDIISMAYDERCLVHWSHTTATIILWIIQHLCNGSAGVVKPEKNMCVKTDRQNIVHETAVRKQNIKLIHGKRNCNNIHILICDFVRQRIDLVDFATIISASCWFPLYYHHYLLDFLYQIHILIYSKII